MLVGKRTRREEKSDGMTCQKVNDRLIFTAFTFRLGTIYLLHISLTLCKVVPTFFRFTNIIDWHRNSICFLAKI